MQALRRRVPWTQAALAAVLLLALLSRVLYITMAVRWAAPPEYDGVGYDQIARNLLAGQGFALEQPTAFRPPGYPLFLAGVYALSGGSVVMLRVIQALLGAITVWVVYKVTLLAFSRSLPALLAALLAALHPASLYLAGIVYPEVLAVLLVTLSLWILTAIAVDRRASIGRLLALGLLLGLAILLRPALLAFAGLAALYVALAAVPEHRLARAALLPACILFCLAPWTFRNAVRFHELIPLATEGGVTFWGGNNPLAHGGNVMPSEDTWLAEDPPESMYGWQGLSETQSEGRFFRAAVNWIAREPAAFLRLLPQKLARSWTLAFGNEARSEALPGWVQPLYLLFPLSVAAGLALSWRHRARLVPAYGLLLAGMAITLVFYGSTRQFALAIPATLVFAAYALERLARAGAQPLRARLRSTR